MITEHKRRLLDARPRIEPTWQHRLEPGREHVGEDGGRILATERELFHIGHNGPITRTEPNGGQAFRCWKALGRFAFTGRDAARWQRWLLFVRAV